MTETSISELVEDLRAAGVTDRHAMYHCSMKALGAVEGGPQGVVDAMVEAAGGGAVLLPTFDYESFTERGYWNRQESKSRMGLITEMGRSDPRFIRTVHPIISFAVYSKSVRGIRESGVENGDILVDIVQNLTVVQQEDVPYLVFAPMDYFTDAPNGHGIGSVFDKFIHNDGLLVLFNTEGFRENDVGYTLCIHSAVIAEVDWRYTKVFEGTYVDNGIASIRKYSASVCRRDKYVTEVSPAHEQAEKEGIIKRYKFGRATCIVAEARQFHEWSVESHRKNPELWRKVL